MTPAIELNEIVTGDPRSRSGRPGHGYGLRRVLAPPRRFRHRVGGGAAGRSTRRQDHPRLGDDRRRRGRAGARHRGRAGASSARRRRASCSREACESCRKYRGDGRYPRLGRLPPASRRGAFPSRIGEGRGPRRQRAVEPGALADGITRPRRLAPQPGRPLVRRRDLVRLFGGAAAVPCAARAQPHSTRCRASSVLLVPQAAAARAPRSRIATADAGASSATSTAAISAFGTQCRWRRARRGCRRWPRELVARQPDLHHRRVCSEHSWPIHGSDADHSGRDGPRSRPGCARGRRESTAAARAAMSPDIWMFGGADALVGQAHRAR